MTASTTDRSLGTIVRELTQDLSTLFRSEIALAKLEIKQAIAAIGGVGALFAAALFCALLGAALLFVTGILALALVMPAWLATLIVAIIALALAAGLAVAGRKKMATVDFKPSAAVESIKTDIREIKYEIKRARAGGDDDE
jgi:putative superfamily III holin-X